MGQRIPDLACSLWCLSPNTILYFGTKLYAFEDNFTEFCPQNRISWVILLAWCHIQELLLCWMLPLTPRKCPPSMSRKSDNLTYNGEEKKSSPSMWVSEMPKDFNKTRTFSWIRNVSIYSFTALLHWKHIRRLLLYRYPDEVVCKKILFPLQCHYFLLYNVYLSVM